MICKVIQPFSFLFINQNPYVLTIANPSDCYVKVSIVCNTDIFCIPEKRTIFLEPKEKENIKIYFFFYKLNKNYKGKIILIYSFGNFNSVISYNLKIKIKELPKEVPIALLTTSLSFL